jgi:hypothetical protein
MLIGVPVAATPGFGPHFDVSTDPPLELEPPELDVVALEPPLLAAAPELVLLVLLPHAASSAAPIKTARA